MIYVVATLTIKPGSAETLKAAAQPAIAATRAEKGCISYDLFHSVSDPETMVFVERWDTRADLSAHAKQPHLKAWREASDPLVLRKVIEIVHPEKIETY
jgi:quinol monooxygenase YgiN